MSHLHECERWLDTLGDFVCNALDSIWHGNWTSHLGSLIICELCEWTAGWYRVDSIKTWNNGDWAQWEDKWGQWYLKYTVIKRCFILYHGRLSWKHWLRLDLLQPSYCEKLNSPYQWQKHRSESLRFIFMSHIYVSNSFCCCLLVFICPLCYTFCVNTCHI